MPTMTMTQKAYRELEQAAQMSGATKNVVLEKALSRYLAELRKNAKDARLAERLDKTIQSRIKKHMSEIATLDDPRSRGKALTSNFAGLWRYRVSDYRILCRIYDDKLVITVIEIAHRSTIYR